MIVKGTKIELVKAIPMCNFIKVGEVCEVINMSENGSIQFRFGTSHMGIMTFGEFKEYFKLHEEKKEPKRIWTPWIMKSFCYRNIRRGLDAVLIEYRHNGKTIQVRTKGPKGKLQAKASCCKEDKFDFEKGLDLALARLNIKILTEEVNMMAEKM